jgi:phosphinothricin acetyltransferase
MDYVLSPLSADDREAVMDIFNYYIENSFAAYPEQRLPYAFFDMLLKMSEGYPNVTARTPAGEFAGYGMLRAFNPMAAFDGVAEISYFIDARYTGQGLGGQILSYLESEARKQGLKSILASISALNEGSLKFHLKNGFVECGRFRNIGHKNNQTFDVIWMQKQL